MYLYHLNIGSNIGDSRSILERAVAAVSRLSEAPARRSSVYESEPWGFESPNMFLNVAVEVFSSLEPLAFLAAVQQIERGISPASHRNPDGTYRDRLVDIDLIFAAILPPPVPQAVYQAVPQAAPRSIPLSEPKGKEPTGLQPISKEPAASEPTEPTSESDRFDLLRITTDELTLPHPRAALRQFVIHPLLELHPSFDLTSL